MGITFLTGLLLAFLPISANGVGISAYAAENEVHNDEQGRQAHANGDNGKSTQTSHGSSNEHTQYKNSTDTATMNEGKTHSKVEERRMQYANKTAEERHKEHLMMHSPVAGQYSINMNYTLIANGNATSISDNSTSTISYVSLDLSIWKSTKGLVSMDIMNGTITIGNNTSPIQNGHAYYLIHNHQIRVLGFITDTTTISGNDSQGNKTASTGLKVLELRTVNDKNEGNVLPTSSSNQPLQISIVSPQSKLASEWFLKMDGEVKAG
jgi:hypothetical protein